MALPAQSPRKSLPAASKVFQKPLNPDLAKRDFLLREAFLFVRFYL
jgi:hypothetical protein